MLFFAGSAGKMELIMFILERLMRSLKSFARFSGEFFRRGSIELVFDSSRRFLCCGFVNEFFSVGGQVVGIGILSRVVRSVKSFVETSCGLFGGTMVLSGGLR